MPVRSAPPAPAPANAKAAAIVQAATTLFSRYGFRKTSMDQLARQAQVAKPTLYAHFADKDALFVAVVRHVLAQMLAEAEAARQSDDIVLRIAGMLSAKFSMLWALVDSSPHARELLESRNAEAIAVSDAADAAFRELLTSALRQASRAGEIDLDAIHLKLPALVTVLMQAASGAGYGVTTVAQHRDSVKSLTRAILRV